MKHVLKYYSSTVKVNVEGDTIISDDAIENLGMRQKFLYAFCSPFARLLKRPSLKSLSIVCELRKPGNSVAGLTSNATDLSALKLAPLYHDHPGPQINNSSRLKAVLIDNLPHPGYFAAGAAAGIVSRTVTAPLDRLKVYLIANTSVAKEALDTVTAGAAVDAAKKSVNPLVTAVKELWKAGGIRSLFTGEYDFSLLNVFDLGNREWLKCCENHARDSNKVWLIRSE